ncbi:MAG TPA: prenyltransferase/squalene oxidase repeat-containing protein [Verrucomicrobiae bacterium]|nr:prenyltransferase/squalene oxidase repeat-containing protein [Verrucomicrobiae bacterium]
MKNFNNPITPRFPWCQRISGLVGLLVIANPVWGAEPALPRLGAERQPNISLRNEVKHAIDKGWAWLEKSQNTNGYWSIPDHPAITALVLTAYRLQPAVQELKQEPESARRGYAYLVNCIQPDGGIYRKDLPSYNTSVALTALVLANHPEFKSAILNARKFIIGLQSDLGEPGKIDTASDGGIGYAKSDKRPDISNTSWALEALYLSKNYLKDKNVTDAGDLNWEAAIHFIQCCQNLPAYNSESWASDDPQNKGGFIYAPGQSMAGQTNLASGRVALRSYGSMSYAGLLSYAYADLKMDDPRVVAVMEWLRNNYTVDENPALGAEGLYYYYLVMSKALAIYGTDTLQTRDGRTIKWREDLALKLLNLQHSDGSWIHTDARWWEKDPILVTAFSMIALEMAYKQM